MFHHRSPAFATHISAIEGHTTEKELERFGRKAGRQAHNRAGDRKISDAISLRF